jgi:hypothetical protein
MISTGTVAVTGYVFYGGKRGQGRRGGRDPPISPNHDLPDEDFDFSKHEGVGRKTRFLKRQRPFDGAHLKNTRSTPSIPPRAVRSDVPKRSPP